MSYRAQILFRTISSSGVTPSADSQSSVAISSSVNSVELAADMTMVSSPSAREAIAALRAT